VASTTKTSSSSGSLDYCPDFQHSIELIGRRWTGSILKVLGDRALRFGEIKGAIPGLSDRLLDTRLKELAAEQIVTRTANHGVVWYSVTAKGSGLQPAFDELARWVDRHSQTNGVADRPGR
jgi:DNA-binding HxlR family transcriptional regulator